MILHFSFSTIEFENLHDDIKSMIYDFKSNGISHKLNSCGYHKKEILVSNSIFIPNIVYIGKVFYDIVFEEDPKNIFIEVFNDTDPKILTGISKKGIKEFNSYNRIKGSPIIDFNNFVSMNRVSVDKLFKDPEDVNNELYGFCVDKIDFKQILEINIMYFNGKDSEVIKQIYNCDEGEI